MISNCLVQGAKPGVRKERLKYRSVVQIHSQAPLPSLFRNKKTLPIRTALLATPLALGTGRLSIARVAEWQTHGVNRCCVAYLRIGYVASAGSIPASRSISPGRRISSAGFLIPTSLV